MGKTFWVLSTGKSWELFLYEGSKNNANKKIECFVLDGRGRWDISVFAQVVSPSFGEIVLRCGTMDGNIEDVSSIKTIGVVNRGDDGRVYIASLEKLWERAANMREDGVVHLKTIGASQCLDNLLELGKGVLSCEDALCHEAKRLIVDELKAMGLLSFKE